MKYIFSPAILFILLSFRFTDGSVTVPPQTRYPPQDTIYNISLNAINGSVIDLAAFRGKKVLVVVLPLSQQDTSIIVSELNTVLSRYGDSLIVLGVPAEEFGYTTALDQQVTDMYNGLPAGFIMTAGIKVKKTSGAGQSALFRWLTHSSKNGYFDREVGGTGDKFFINEKGRLYASVSSQVRLSGSLVEKMLSATSSN